MNMIRSKCFVTECAIDFILVLQGDFSGHHN